MGMNTNFDLIIFDCDGTLVDTEPLYAAVTCDLLHENGLTQYTPESCFAEFHGTAWSHIRKTLEDRHQTKLCDNIIERYIHVSRERMQTSLQTIQDAMDVVTHVHGTHDICIGSNGERFNVLQSLNITGLNKFFPEEKVFTKIQVERPKPHPDLFLYAATQMGHAPERTLVIEDSTSGVKAGVAAGMHVIGFTGSAPDPEAAEQKLRDAGAHTIMQQLIHIPDYLK